MKIKIDLQPIRVPNFVLTASKTGRREEGIKETPKFALSELSGETLSELCDQFRRDVFAKSGIPDPKK